MKIQKLFFGKDNCLKINLTDNKECFFEFGKSIEKKENENKEEKQKWFWKTIKFSDIELGEIIDILEKNEGSKSFFHNFKGEKTQIWIKKNQEYFNIKIKEVNKGLSRGEQIVFRELLKKIILEISTKK